MVILKTLSPKPIDETNFLNLLYHILFTKIMTNPISKLITYIQESIAEMKKVTWPTKKQTANYTLLVIGISLAVATFIGLVDFILTLGVEKVLTK